MKETQITYYGDMQFCQVKFIWNPEILIEGYAIVLNYVLLGTATILQKTPLKSLPVIIRLFKKKKSYPVLYSIKDKSCFTLSRSTYYTKKIRHLLLGSRSFLFSGRKPSKIYCCCEVPPYTGKCNSKPFLKNSDT